MQFQRKLRYALPQFLQKPFGITLMLEEDGVQYLHHRALDYLVFQRGDAERPKPPVRFRNEVPT
jgi:hypothetical protein